MPEMPRGVDFLHLHNNVQRRVRNLETGVHPTRGDHEYLDTYDPQALSMLPGSRFGSVDGKWQRRSGIVTLLGRLVPHGGYDWNELDAEEPVAQLPVPARPLSELVFNISILYTPFFAQMRVTTAGVVSILKPAGAAANNGYAFLSGANWTAN